MLYTFGALELEEGFQDGNTYSSCEISESFFAYWYTEDDSLCYWNQLMRGQTCGCPDNSEIEALVWTQRSSGILSLSGSLLIIMSIITKPRSVRWSPYNQIVLGISFLDSLSSIAYIIGLSFTPKELGYPGSRNTLNTVVRSRTRLSKVLVIESLIGTKGNLRVIGNAVSEIVKMQIHPQVCIIVVSTTGN